MTGTRRTSAPPPESEPPDITSPEADDTPSVVPAEQPAVRPPPPEGEDPNMATLEADIASPAALAELLAVWPQYFEGGPPDTTSSEADSAPSVAPTEPSAALSPRSERHDTSSSEADAPSSASHVRDAIGMEETRPAEFARRIYDVGLLNLPSDEDSSGEEDDGSAAAPNPSRRKPKSGFLFKAIIFLLVVHWFGPRIRPSLFSKDWDPSPWKSISKFWDPRPEYILFKPLNPGPEIAVVDLASRNLALERAAWDTGVLILEVYRRLERHTADYCRTLESIVTEDFRDHLGRNWKKDDPRQFLDFSEFMKLDPVVVTGPARKRQSALCDKLGELTFGIPWDVRDVKDILMVWTRITLEDLWALATELKYYLPMDGYNTELIEGGGAHSLGDKNRDDLRRALSHSDATEVLRTIMGWATIVRDISPKGEEFVTILNDNIERIVALTEELLEPSLEEWLALNRPDNNGTTYAVPRPSQKQLKKLATYRDQARNSFNVVKDTLRRYSSWRAEFTAATRSDADQLAKRVENIIDGRGWTQLVLHGEQWVLERYYYAVRPSLPDQLFGLAYTIGEQSLAFSNEKSRQWQLYIEGAIWEGRFRLWIDEILQNWTYSWYPWFREIGIEDAIVDVIIFGCFGSVRGHIPANFKYIDG